MVSIDTAATRAFVQTSQDVAKGLGVNLDTLFIPPDTTDFAPVAAQIAERKPSGLGLILTTQMVPFFNALADENISPHDIPIFTAVTLMPPEVAEAARQQGRRRLPAHAAGPAVGHEQSRASSRC